MVNTVQGAGYAVRGRRGAGRERSRSLPQPGLWVCVGATSRPHLAGVLGTRQQEQVGLRFVFMNKFHFARATKKKKKPQHHPWLHRVNLLSFQPMCLITPPKAML